MPTLDGLFANSLTLQSKRPRDNILAHESSSGDALLDGLPEYAQMAGYLQTRTVACPGNEPDGANEVQLSPDLALFMKNMQLRSDI